jgi:hypothetical protein
MSNILPGSVFLPLIPADPLMSGSDIERERYNITYVHIGRGTLKGGGYNITYGMRVWFFFRKRKKSLEKK